MHTNGRLCKRAPARYTGWVSRRGWVLFAAMSVVWGIPYFFIRIAVRQLDPGVLVLGRTAPAALVLIPLVLRGHHLSAVRRHLGWIAAFAFVEFGIPWYLMATAERHISSSLTSLLIAAVPLISVVVQLLRRNGERFAPRRYSGLLVGAAGVILLVVSGAHSGSLRWIGLMMVITLGYTFGPMILATKLADVPGVAVVAGATAMVAIAWTPWAIAHWPRHVNGETLSSVAILSLICTAGAFLIFFELVKEVGSTRGVVVTYTNTAIAVVLGIAFLHEPLTSAIAVGFPLVLLGSILATAPASAAERVDAFDVDELLHG